MIVCCIMVAWQQQQQQQQQQSDPNLMTNQATIGTETMTPGYGFRSAGYRTRVEIAAKEYYFGVIDILETWSWSKKLERFFKVYILGQAGDDVSCINPIDFKDCYQRPIGRVIEHSDIVREVTGSWQGKSDIGSAQDLVVGDNLIF